MRTVYAHPEFTLPRAGQPIGPTWGTVVDTNGKVVPVRSQQRYGTALALLAEGSEGRVTEVRYRVLLDEPPLRPISAALHAELLCGSAVTEV